MFITILDSKYRQLLDNETLVLYSKIIEILGPLFQIIEMERSSIPNASVH